MTKDSFYYYSYIAATAETSPTGSTAEDSICPKGWHIQKSLTGGQEIMQLVSSGKYTVAELRGQYAKFTLSGRFMPGATSIVESGSSGYYWSNYRSTNGSSYETKITQTGNTSGVFDTANRFSIRCVKR